MAEVVPSELRDLGAFKERCPCLLEAGSDFKDAFPTLRLIAPTLQYTSGLLIEENVTSLATLRSSTFDGEDLQFEVNALPTQRQQLAAPKPGVHREQYRGR